jgi:hypothetical protein
LDFWLRTLEPLPTCAESSMNMVTWVAGTARYLSLTHDLEENVTSEVDERMDPMTRCLILGMPFAFLAHDVGEVRGNAELNDAFTRLASGTRWGRRVAGAMRTSDRQMAVAVAALTAACVVVSVRAARSPVRTGATAQFAAATAVMGGHLLAHVGQSLLLRRPVPGLGGGLLVTVPYSVVVLARLHRRGYVDAATVARAGGAAALALGPALVVLRLLARRAVQ